MPTDPSLPPPSEPLERLFGQLRQLTKGLEALAVQVQFPADPVVDVLPPPGRIGRRVVLRETAKPYWDTGTSWITWA